MGKTTPDKSRGSISDDAVKQATGKTWAKWFALLDRAGCCAKSHQEIVAVLSDRHRVRPWWRQMVTVAYERARGLRARHQKPEGYEISVSKTIAAPAARAFQAWHDASLRKRWLADPGFKVRKATPNKSLRITWVDERTHVDATIYPKGEGKCQAVAQHGKLASAREAEDMQRYWQSALDRLKDFLEH
jgi:uncharacterized protein YndB with AHSA1/START domain